MRQWRRDWPKVYETLLEHLVRKWPDGRGVREFVTMLELHRDHPATLIEEAVTQALALGCAHYDGVLLCLRQLSRQEKLHPSLELDPSLDWTKAGAQPVELTQYDQLLTNGL